MIDKADAHGVMTRLQPVHLLEDDGQPCDARKYIDQLAVMRRLQTWNDLDTLMEHVQRLDPLEAHSPVLLLSLTDACIQAGKYRSAEACCAEAARRLEIRFQPPDVHNRAVATLFMGIILHLMGRAADALYFYAKARSQFQAAAANWRVAEPDNPRALLCSAVGTQLQDLEVRLVANAPHVATGSTWHPPACTPEPEEAQQSVDSTPQMSPSRTVAVVALLCLAAIAPGVLIFFILKALAPTLVVIALVAFLAAWLIGSIILTRVRLTLRVAPGTAAIIERNGVQTLVGTPGRLFFLPQSRRARAVVPMGELAHTVRRQKVVLGKDHETRANRSVFMTIHLTYCIVRPLDLIGFVDGSTGNDGAQHAVLRQEELRKICESQLQSDLVSLLVNQLRGASEKDCYDYQAEIQANLRHELARRCKRWGTDIRELTVLEVEPA